MRRITSIFQSASAGGILLFLAAVAGFAVANSAYAPAYFYFLHAPLGPLKVELWINDVLMAIFFLVVGLEVKREMIDGELNTRAKRVLPGIGAFFGLAMPALIYTAINWAYPEFCSGWAIPAATDIAFAMGIVAILGDRVPVAMKVFLTTLAVMDDLMAIVIIAIFYTASLQFLYLAGAAIILVVLIGMNKKNVLHPVPYIVLGLGLWFCVFHSGLHATLAGVLLAMTIPYKGIDMLGRHHHPVLCWEHALSNWVTFLIVPLFGFANAGVSVAGFSVEQLFHPVVIGVAAGLFLGKQIGVFGTLFVLVKAKIVPMPEHTTWVHVYGVALCCGIGFTMSLFINLLAFAPGMAQEVAKIGVFIGSILAGVAGYAVLRLAKRA